MTSTQADREHAGSAYHLQSTMHEVLEPRAPNLLLNDDAWRKEFHEERERESERERERERAIKQSSGFESSSSAAESGSFTLTAKLSRSCDFIPGVDE